MERLDPCAIGSIASHLGQENGTLGHMSKQVAPGFLAAAPSLLDPNFHRSLVLLIEHRTEGSLGFIINRPSMTTMRDVAGVLGLPTDAPLADGPVLAGGPMAPQTGWIIFDPDGMELDPEDSVAVSAKLRVSASRDLLERIARGEGPERRLFALGYAGWGPGQLDAELAKGVWLPLDLDESIVFDTPYDSRWEAALRNAGIDPARLSIPPRA